MAVDASAGPDSTLPPHPTDPPDLPQQPHPPGGPAQACVFARALLARAASGPLVRRRSVGEREAVACPSPTAHANCDTLAALMHERARFALRLPAPGLPLMHAQAMRLQCGGLAGLRRALAPAPPGPAGQAGPSVANDVPDVHALVGLAQQRHGSLTALPWEAIVASMRAWTPRRRRAPPVP
jgi:hypothetical protein